MADGSGRIVPHPDPPTCRRACAPQGERHVAKAIQESRCASPLLVRLIEAAERSNEDAEGRNIRGMAQGLRELGDLAAWVLPLHGLFVPNNNEVCMVVDRVARQHFDLEEARRDFKDAMSVVV